MKLYFTALALAFNDSLHYHPTLVKIIKDCFSCGTFPSPAYKMAYVSNDSNEWCKLNDSMLILV